MKTEEALVAAIEMLQKYTAMLEDRLWGFHAAERSAPRHVPLGKVVGRNGLLVTIEAERRYADDIIALDEVVYTIRSPFE